MSIGEAADGRCDGGPGPRRPAMEAVAAFLRTARPPAAWPAPRLRMRAGGWRCLAIGLALAVGGSCGHAQTDATAAEYRIKAAFLLKFLDFVDWPSTATEPIDTPFLIGVLGSRPLGNALDQAAAGRRLNGHPVQVRVLARDESATALQMLFIGRAEAGSVATIASATNGRPLLLVAESESALAQGAVINFVVVDDKVRFDVSLRAADRAGLKISARLLAVARNVLPSTP